MNTKLKLPGILQDCPDFWKNFIEHCRQGFDSRKHVDCIDYLNSELRLYGAQAYFGADNFIEFNTDQEYLLFLLRWS